MHMYAPLYIHIHNNRQNTCTHAHVCTPLPSEHIFANTYNNTEYQHTCIKRTPFPKHISICTQTYTITDRTFAHMHAPPPLHTHTCMHTYTQCTLLYKVKQAPTHEPPLNHTHLVSFSEVQPERRSCQSSRRGSTLLTPLSQQWAVPVPLPMFHWAASHAGSHPSLKNTYHTGKPWYNAAVKGKSQTAYRL